MVALTFQQFNGEMPRISPYYLAEGFAVRAQNVRLTNGALRPLRAGALAHMFPAAGNADFCLHGATWFGFDHAIDACAGPVAEDRLYITHDNGNAPQIYRAGSFYPLALPAPTNVPAVASAGTLDPNTAEKVTYAYTWVTALGEESAPSPLSASADFSAGITLTLSNLPSTLTVNGRPVSGKRIYRSQTSSSGVTDLYFIAQIAAAAVSFVDVFGANRIAEAIPSKGFAAPPTAMRGLTALPNGIMAAFTGKQLLFSEPWQPHAWPDDYKLTTNDYIVGLCAIGTSLAVMTTGMPCIVQGLAPDSMTMQKVESPYPCVAKRSIVDMGYACIYASPVGLVQITEGGAKVITGAIWTQDEWAAMTPSGIKAGRFGEAYAFTCTPAGASAPQVFIVSLNGDQPALVRSSVPAVALFNNPADNALYLLDQDGQSVRRFDAGTPLQYVWKSKPFRFTDPKAMGAVMIHTLPAAGASATVNVYADGALKHSISAANTPARLPAGAHAEWQVEIEGDAEVLRVLIGQTIAEVSG